MAEPDDRIEPWEPIWKEDRIDWEITHENIERFEAWKRLMPDSRTYRTGNIRTIWVPGLGECGVIYCTNCGRCGGAVGKDSTFIHYYCINCQHLAAGLPEIPEPLVRPQEK